MANLTAINFVEEFCQVLDTDGDMFFATDAADNDMKNIIATVKQQGYWAGNRLRYFFDNELFGRGVVKLLKTEERRFGV